MTSQYENFWTHTTYAVIGNSARARFPRLTYGALKERGKKVFAVDPSVPTIEGDKAYPNLVALPESVDAIVIEVPKEETHSWIEQASKAGIKRVWIHMNRDTPEALALAQEKGMDVCYGTCAVQYISTQFFPHGIHRWIRKGLGRY